MDDQQLIDEHLKPIACRLNAIVHILTTSKPDDDIRGVLPTLVEDNYQDFQTLLDEISVEAATPTPSC